MEERHKKADSYRQLKVWPVSKKAFWNNWLGSANRRPADEQRQGALTLKLMLQLRAAIGVSF